MTAVAFVLPSLAGGGAERVMLTLAAGLDRSRFRPSLVLLSGTGPLASMIPADLPVTVLDRPRLRTALPALRRTLVAARPDIVVSTMAYLNFGLLWLAPRLPAGTRVIVREANSPERIAGGGVRGMLYRLAYRRLYRRAHRVVAPSRQIAATLAGFGVPEARIRLLHNPVDTDRLRARAARPERFPGPGRRFVAAGRLTRQKGFDRLIDMAAALAPEDRITLHGDGPLRQELADRAARPEVAGRVALAPFTDDLPAKLAGADACLLPSRWEGLPNVALEALALGTPVIATPEAGGIGEIAEAASSGAVTLAPAGGDFIAAMHAVGPRSLDGARPSLLPEGFSLDGVRARFEALLAE